MNYIQFEARNVNTRLNRNNVYMSMEFGFVGAVVGLFFLLAIMIFLYILSYNGLSTKGYVLSSLEVERERLVQEKEIKLMHIAKVKAMDNVVNREVIQNMRRARNSQITFFDDKAVVAMKME